MQAPQEPFKHLHELVHRYEMTYHVLLEWGADARWHPQRVGFSVELFGLPNPAISPDLQSPTEHVGLHASYEALREVLGWATAQSDKEREVGQVCVTIDDWEHRVVLESKPSTWRAELIAHVTHCGDVRRPLDEHEQHYVEEVKRRLASLGVREH
jgi:hypothetical protein